MLLTQKHIKNRALLVNVNGVLIGLCVGCVINLFFYGLSFSPINWLHVLITFMYSILISLGISNSILMAGYFLSKHVKNLGIAVVVYYGGSLTGVAIGHELSGLIVSLIYKTPYHVYNNLKNLEMSLAIGIIVTTIIFAWQLQKKRYDAILNKQELEVVKLKQLTTQAELQTLQSKINPHFLYNSLNSIASLIHQNADKAEDMTLKLSAFFRYSINTQSENLASVKDELAIVKTYLDIEIVRFGERMEFNYDVDEKLLHHPLPRFLLQPLVENALKHGLANTLKDGKLSIAIKQVNQQLEICVGDNGTPFPAKLTPGYGLESTYEKLNLLYQDNYEVQLINTPQKFIRIRIPV